MPQIYFNGKTYNDIAEMPATERQAYEQMMDMFLDKNSNGIADFLEGDMVKNVMSVYSSQTDINGKAYNSLDDLPPELRESVDSAFKMLANMGILPGMPAQSQVQNQFENPPEALTSKPFISREYNPVIQEDSGSKIWVWLFVAIGLMACLGIAAVAVFFLM